MEHVQYKAMINTQNQKARSNDLAFWLKQVGRLENNI